MSLDARAQDDIAIPAVYMMDWGTGESAFMDSVKTMGKTMEDVEKNGATDASKKLMASMIGTCKRALALMDKARKAAKAL